MGVIDKDPERLAQWQGFQPAGHGGQSVEGGLDFHHINLEGDAGADRGQGVIDVVPSDERQPDGEAPIRRLDHEARPVGVEFNLGGVQPGRVEQAIGQLPFNGGRTGQAHPERIVDVDHDSGSLGFLL